MYASERLWKLSTCRQRSPGVLNAAGTNTIHLVVVTCAVENKYKDEYGAQDVWIPTKDAALLANVFHLQYNGRDGRGYS